MVYCVSVTGIRSIRATMNLSDLESGVACDPIFSGGSL